jgi:hypothetical protein
VTPTGSVVFFAQYLKTGGLLDRFCDSSPLEYKSNNAPAARDVMGTLLLSVLNGQTRYAHINALRSDRVGAEVLGLGKVVSEDSVRRALGRGTEEAWDTWLAGLDRTVVEPLLAEAYVLDIDSTVKPLYGHQEGAELGYNPKKPGRPSHNCHTYFIGALRLVLGVDVQPGKQHSGGCGMPACGSSSTRCLPGVPPAADTRGRGLRQREGHGAGRGARAALPVQAEALAEDQVAAPGAGGARRAWTDAGEGWQASESRLKLAAGQPSDGACSCAAPRARSRPAPPGRSSPSPRRSRTRGHGTMPCW